MRVDGAVALIGGGASGLGRATAELLRERGAEVVILDLPAAEEKAEGFAFAGADVRDPDQVGAAVELAKSLGELRICVNCAGIGDPQRVVRKGEPHDLERFRRVVEVNLIGTFNLMRLAAAAMVANEPLDEGGRGVIVNTASVAAFDGQVGQASYAASKGGIVGLTLPAARDLSDSLIRVATIAPGIFDTPLLGELPQTVRDSLGAMVPHPSRLGRPEEFAAMALAIVENEYLNGEVIRLDGAIRMAPR
ncbi:MAG: SDR family NAD(P)-dependent oxidoreductase [Solirubrobacterales bacterium]|nr:SDR family NAD(P)-dependent oxidoreductase [Solirubrobacterales bacterium]